MQLFKMNFSKQPLPRPNVLAVILGILAVVAFLLAVAATVLMILGYWQTEYVKVLLIALFLVSGTSAAAALAALIILLRYLFSLASSSRLIERAGRRSLLAEQMPSGAEGAAPTAAAGEATPPAGADRQQVIVELLSEIVENTLLEEPERRERRKAFRERRIDDMRRSIEGLIEQKQWEEAQRVLDNLRERYPEFADADQLQQQLQAALRQSEDSEVQNATEQIRSFISLGLWDRALEVAQETAERCPDNKDAQQLAQTVMLELEATQKEDRRRLYQEIEHLVGRRKWPEAYATAQTLLERHPDSAEANKLKDQIDELKHNAEVHERREAEQLITEHLHVGRYKQAYEIARDLIQKYPGSPQAEALKERMDWLREMAGVKE